MPNTLYSSSRSPFGRKVQIVLLEKGVPFERVDVDLGRRDEAFWALNPLGKIPVLRLGELVIPDSTVICETLEDRFPTPPMYEADRLRCRILDELGDTIGDQSVQAMVARNRGDAAAVEQHLGRVERLLNEVGRRQAAGEWPPGFTIADAAVISGLGYLTFRHGDAWRARHPGLAAWLDAASARPSVAATVPVG